VSRSRSITPESWRWRFFSGGLALLLVALGLFVRSEEAHDGFHRHLIAQHHHSAHVHRHADAHGHHSHGASHDPVRHEHTSPLIDLLAEEQLDVAAPMTLPVARFSVVELPSFRCSGHLPQTRVAQPPGRAPPSRLFS